MLSARINNPVKYEKPSILGEPSLPNIRQTLYE